MTMINYLYRAYCRSVTRAQCNMAVLAIALVIIILSYLAGHYVIMHERGILQGLRDIAAVGLCAAGLVILAAAVRSARRARVTTSGMPEVIVTADVPSGRLTISGITAVTGGTGDSAVMAAEADALAGGILDIRVSGDGRTLIETGPDRG